MSARWIGVMSGERQDLPARLLRPLLRGLAAVYAMLMRLRRFTYRRLRWRVSQPRVPVISVGNITTGGTGKTPAVALLCQRLLDLGRRPAVVSRGYGGDTGDLNDEARILRRLLPDVPLIQDPRRARGVARAVEDHQVDVAVLDDGFQHQACGRDLDIVLIDATNPFGHGYVLPRGLLREPLSALAEAHALIITRCDQVEPAVVDELEQTLARLAPDAIRARAEHRAIGYGTVEGGSEELSALAGRPAASFCGIGNPSSFRRVLSEAGLQLVYSHDFPDHHAYEQDELVSVEQAAAAAGAEALVTTRKDLVKPQVEAWARQSRLRVLVLDIEFRLTRGDTALWELVAQAIGGRSRLAKP